MPECPGCHHEIPEGATACSECGQEITASSPVGRIPWENRSEIGFFKALFETVKLVITRPTEIFSAIEKNGDWGSPILYAVIVCWIGEIFQTLYGMLVFSVISVPISFTEQLPFSLPFLVGGAAIFGLFLAPVFILFAIFIISGLLHLAAMILGDGEGGFEVTFKTVAYSATSQLAQIIPMCGDLLGQLWGIVLVMIGMTKSHRTETWKGILAPILVVVVFMCCIGMFIAFVLMGAAAGHS